MPILSIIRHPKPQVAANTCYGQLDLPVGEIELAATCARLQGALTPLAGQRVLTSDLQRCWRLAEALGISATPSPLWRERHFGQWEGKHWDQISPQAVDQWLHDPWHFAPPKGESLWQMFKRLLTALAGIEENTLVFCHAGVAKCLDVLLAHKALYEGESLGYGEVRQYRLEKSWWPRRYGTEGALLQKLAATHWWHDNTR